MDYLALLKLPNQLTPMQGYMALKMFAEQPSGIFPYEAYRRNFFSHCKLRCNQVDERFRSRWDAMNGIDLDKHVNSIFADVRAGVALAGGYLDELALDGNAQVLATVASVSYRHHETLIKTKKVAVLEAIAKTGRYHDSLIHHSNPRVLIGIAEAGGYHEQLSMHSNRNVREAVALAGGAHETLHKDPEVVVRAAVAKAGGYHDELCYDPSAVVVAAVAEAGGHHDLLWDNKKPTIRAAVAKAGSYHHRLAKDKSKSVRQGMILGGRITEADLECEVVGSTAKHALIQRVLSAIDRSDWECYKENEAKASKFDFLRLMTA